MIIKHPELFPKKFIEMLPIIKQILSAVAPNAYIVQVLFETDNAESYVTLKVHQKVNPELEITKHGHVWLNTTKFEDIIYVAKSIEDCLFTNNFIIRQNIKLRGSKSTKQIKYNHTLYYRDIYTRSEQKISISNKLFECLSQLYKIIPSNISISGGFKSHNDYLNNSDAELNSRMDEIMNTIGKFYETLSIK